jgi:hypothetical protein
MKEPSSSVLHPGSLSWREGGSVKLLVALLLIAGSIGLAAQRRQAVLMNGFEDDAVGQAPRGFVFGEIRDAPTKRWSVHRDGTNQLLVHSGDVAAGRGFATAVLAAPRLREVELSVRVRFLAGDRAGGLVWRYGDARNYSFVQLALGADQSLGLYRMVDGNRVRLEVEDDLQLDPSGWHTLKVIQGERRVRVYLGGIRVFEERDRRRAVGTVGVWSGGSSVAQFDDLRVESNDN